jgi:hypothetical protein
VGSVEMGETKNKSGKSRPGQADRRPALWFGSDNIFDPEASPFDNLTYRALSHALKNEFAQPFVLQFLDPIRGVIKEVQITTRGPEVLELPLFERPGLIRFPLTCNLTDRNGRTYKVALTDQDFLKQMPKQRIDGWQIEGDVLHVKYHTESSNFSPQVFLTLIRMLTEAMKKGLEAPFRVAVLDAHAQLHASEEIGADADGNFVLVENVVHCSHLTFPLTIKLVDRTGAETLELVEREASTTPGQRRR